MDNDTGFQTDLIFLTTSFPKYLCSKPVVCSVMCSFWSYTSGRQCYNFTILILYLDFILHRDGLEFLIAEEECS